MLLLEVISGGGVQIRDTGNPEPRGIQTAGAIGSRVLEKTWWWREKFEDNVCSFLS